MPPVALCLDKAFCHQMQQVISVSPVTDEKAWAVYTLATVRGRYGPVILLFYSSTDQHDKQDSIKSLLSESDHHSPGVAQHALVLGPGKPVIPDIIVPR